MSFWTTTVLTRNAMSGWRSINWFKEGKWVHLAKVAFEKYFLRKIRKGATEPLYEKYVLGVLGIKKPK